MDKFLTQKYERIVLRPEINNSELQSACIKEIHDQYLDTNMTVLVDSNTTNQLSLDWSLQMYKIKSVPVNFEKSSELNLALSSNNLIS